jgi:curved DNA-binding protein
MRNPYDVLGVARNADQEAIRKAYKTLARKYHPDRNKAVEAEAKFKEINAAYDVVGDDKKRKWYDEFGDVSLQPGFDPEKARAWSRAGGQSFRGGPGPGVGGFDFGFGGDGGGGMDDLLGSLFGMGGGKRTARGRDQQATLAVEPMLAIVGGETSINLQRPHGAETLKVRIPAGVNDGGTLRLKGQGLPPPGGGPCGDLLLKLEVSPHPRLRRTGDDLELDVPITVLEALRGASITVPTPTGDVKVSIPAGSSSGARLRIRGRGVQRTGTPGDLFLRLQVATPPSAPELIEAAEVLERAYTKPVRADLAL